MYRMIPLLTKNSSYQLQKSSHLFFLPQIYHYILKNWWIELRHQLNVLALLITPQFLLTSSKIFSQLQGMTTQSFQRNLIWYEAKQNSGKLIPSF